MLFQEKKTLNRSEKLKSRKEIENLFKAGVSSKAGCIQLLFLEKQDSSIPKVLFAVPKSKIPKANQRNTIKRRMREAYRLNKHRLNAKTEIFSFSIGFIFGQKTICNYCSIENSIIDQIDWINKKLEKK